MFMPLENLARTTWLAGAATLALAGAAQATTYANLEVTSVVSEIVGSTAVITGSGSKDNTDTWTLNQSARFILSGDDGTQAQNPVSYGLDIKVVGATGGFADNTDSLMIAQTVDSQGLTDTGTVSIYINPTATSWTGSFELTFYDPTFTNLASPNVMLTSLDLDYGQKMRLDANQTSDAYLNEVTDVVFSQSADVLNFQGNGTATFADPEAAVIATYDGRSTVDVDFLHDGVALFVLEFRNPSAILQDTHLSSVSSVPLPAGLPLIGFGVLALGWVGRKKRDA